MSIVFPDRVAQSVYQSVFPNSHVDVTLDDERVKVGVSDGLGNIVVFSDIKVDPQDTFEGRLYAAATRCRDALVESTAPPEPEVPVQLAPVSDIRGVL